MFALRKKSFPLDGLSAVGFLPSGVGVARVLRQGDGPAVLDGCALTPLGPQTDKTRALKALKDTYGLDAVPTSVVMTAADYALSLIEAPDVPADERSAAVRWRIQDLIDYPAEEAVIDVFDVPAREMTQQGRMLYAVAGRVGKVEEKVVAAHRAGLDVSIVDIQELAQRNIAACLPEDVAGVALLYLTEEAGLITLTRQSVLYLARRLDWGSGILGPLPGSAHVDEETDAAGEPPPEALGWLDSLVVEIQRSLDYYESHFAQAPINSLVVAPMERRVPGLTAYLSAQLGLAVRRLDLSEAIDCPQPVDAVLQSRCFPVIGAALRQAPAMQ